MHQPKIIIGLRIITFLLAIICNNKAIAQEFAEQPNNQTITIMADPSLTVVINLIARQYSLENNVAITTIFSPQQKNVQDIQDGEKSDVIIAAKTSWIEDMQQKGLIDVFSKRNIARNNLVIAASQFNFSNPNIDEAKQTGSIESFGQNGDDFMLAIGDVTATAEGAYTMEAIEKYNLSSALEPHYVFVNSPYEIVRMIEKYDTIGVLFRTDAQLFPQIKELKAFSSDSHSAIIYQAAAVVGENMEISREFIKYLSEKYARDVFHEYGFSTFF